MENNGGVDTNPSLTDEAVKTFLDTFKESDRSFIQERGYKSNEDVAAALKNAVKFDGVNLDNMVALPTDKSTPEELAAFYAKLGRPEKADGYKFNIPDGESDGFAKSLAPILHEAGLSQKQLDVLMPKWNEMIKANREADAKALAEDNDKALAALKTEWAADFDKNVELAKRATQAAGFDANEIDALVKVKGSAWAYKTMAKFGKLIGDGEIKGINGALPANLSNPKEALAKIERLKKDRAFAAKIVKGDEAAIKEWDTLHNVAFGAVK